MTQDRPISSIPLTQDAVVRGLKELKLSEWFANKAPPETVLVADQNLIEGLGLASSQRTTIICDTDLASAAAQRKLKNTHLAVVADLEDELSAVQRVQHLVGAKSVSGLISDICQSLSLNGGGDQTIAQIDATASPERSYAVLCTARSGSTWFCHLLQNTGCLGHPTEHLRPPVIFMACHADRFGFSLSQWCDRLMRARQKDDVFATKVIDDFLDDLSNASLVNERTKLDHLTADTRLIHFEREDKVAQAVSKFMAMRTTIWHLRQEERADAYRARKAEIDYDGPTLKAVFDGLVRNEDRYRDFLKSQSRPTLHLTYETALADPEAAVRAVAEFVLDDTPDDLSVIHERYFPMADDINARFAAQLRADYRL